MSTKLQLYRLVQTFAFEYKLKTRCYCGLLSEVRAKRRIRAAVESHSETTFIVVTKLNA